MRFTACNLVFQDLVSQNNGGLDMLCSLAMESSKNHQKHSKTICKNLQARKGLEAPNSSLKSQEWLMHGTLRIKCHGFLRPEALLPPSVCSCPSPQSSSSSTTRSALPPRSAPGQSWTTFRTAGHPTPPAPPAWSRQLLAFPSSEL